MKKSEFEVELGNIIKSLSNLETYRERLLKNIADLIEQNRNLKIFLSSIIKKITNEKVYEININGNKIQYSNQDNEYVELTIDDVFNLHMSVKNPPSHEYPVEHDSPPIEPNLDNELTRRLKETRNTCSKGSVKSFLGVLEEYGGGQKIETVYDITKVLDIVVRGLPPKYVKAYDTDFSLWYHDKKYNVWFNSEIDTEMREFLIAYLIFEIYYFQTKFVDGKISENLYMEPSFLARELVTTLKWSKSLPV